jgi:hypothetical protein
MLDNQDQAATETGAVDDSGNTDVPNVPAEVNEDAATETENHEDKASAYSFDEENNLYKFKADGEEVSVGIDDLVSKFSLGKNAARKNHEYKQLNEQRDVEHKQRLEEVTTAKQKVEDLAKELETLVSEQQESINWDELRDTDTSEYLRQKELLDKRQSALKKANSERSELEQKNRTDRVTLEAQRLLESVGEWSDPKVRDEEIKEINSYLTEKGLSPEDISQMVDHRYWLVSRDAAKYKALLAKSESVKEELKDTPASIKSQKADKNPPKSIEDVFYGT